jgi:hypothetical protein
LAYQAIVLLNRLDGEGRRVGPVASVFELGQ